jgi:hypothetical protein
VSATGAIATAREALRLRAWALHVFASGPGARAPSGCSAEGWHAFLRGEACALPLSHRLGRAGVEALPGDGARLLAAAAMSEQRYWLSARAQAHQLGTWARQSGKRVVVLKGGLAAAAGEPEVGMLDLDVLAPDGADPVAEYLDAVGHRAGYAGEGGHHLPTRVAPGVIGVEVHRWLDGFEGGLPALDRLRPVGRTGLLSLAADDHAWHVLVHGAVSHRDRRGRLRELLLLADARAACGGEEWANVRRRASAHPLAPLLASLGGAAEALAAGRAPDDPAPLAAAGRYLGGSWLRTIRLPRRLQRDLLNATFSLLHGGADYRELWASALSAPAPAGARAGLGVRRAWRVARLSAASAGALLLASAARRAAR